MKRELLGFAAITFVILVMTGCYSHVDMANKLDKSDYSVSSKGMVYPPSPSQIGDLQIKEAVAYSIRQHAKSQEHYNGAISRIKKKDFVGVIINDDPYHAITVPHPELPMKIVVKPNDFEFIFTAEIPRQFSVYLPRKRVRLQKPAIYDGEYAGLRYNYGIRIVDAR